MYVNSCQLPALIRVKLLLSSCLGSWGGMASMKSMLGWWTYTSMSKTHIEEAVPQFFQWNQVVQTYPKSSRDCNVSPTSSFRIALHAPCIHGHSERAALCQPRRNKRSWVVPMSKLSVKATLLRWGWTWGPLKQQCLWDELFRNLGSSLNAPRCWPPNFMHKLNPSKILNRFGILQNPEQLLKLGNQALCTEANPAIRKNIGQCDLWTSATQNLWQTLPWNPVGFRAWFNHLQLCFCAENRTTPIQLDRPVAIFPWSKTLCKHDNIQHHCQQDIHGTNTIFCFSPW